MEISKDKPIFQIHTWIVYLKRLTTFALAFASFCLIISIILFLTYGQNCWNVESIAEAIIWYSIFIGIYTAFFSIWIIIIQFIYLKQKRQAVWTFIKKEVVLLILTVALILIFSLLTYLSTPGHKAPSNGIASKISTTNLSPVMI